MQKAIDVSVMQGVIDWKKVRASGISAAMVKASQGRSEQNADLRNFADSRFRQNVNDAYAAGLHIGTYHYLTAWTEQEAREEAMIFLDTITPLRGKITLWAAVDVESRYLPVSVPRLTAIVRTFCDAVQTAGFQPMVYTNPDFLLTRLGDLSMYPLWLANWYTSAPVNNAPNDALAARMKERYPAAVLWQWGLYGPGRVSGISASCDGDTLLDSAEPAKSVASAPKVGNRVMITDNAVYTNGVAVPLWVRVLPLYVRYINADIITISILKTGAVTGKIDRKYIKKIL